MKVVMFYHSLVSDWNHGNAHFLRGVAAELCARGHDVVVHEPRDGWSRANLLADHGDAPLRAFARAYPQLRSVAYDLPTLELDAALAGADLVLVHEWSDHALVGRIGAHRRAGGGYRLLFHDTHHRSVSEPASMAAYDLSGYDGVLAFGATVRDVYRARGWAQRVWVWHEAADAGRFCPPANRPPGEIDLVWIGNFGDDERTAELEEFLIGPVRALRLSARVHGVRYPPEARRRLADAGIEYAGWLPNFDVPAAFARARVTLHVPRRPYVRTLPGVPTIRMFEALACGIPLVSAPWSDCEGLFRAGRDYLVARDGAEMCRHLRALLASPARAQEMAAEGRRTVAARHTCAHRVDELLGIMAELDDQPAAAGREANEHERTREVATT